MAWNKYTVTHTQLQAASTTKQIVLDTVNSSRVLTGVIMKHSQVFAGTTPFSSYKISVGTAASPKEYATEFNALQSVSASNYKSTIVQKVVTFTNTATNIVVTATADHNLNDSTAGLIEIWVQTDTLP